MWNGRQFTAVLLYGGLFLMGTLSACSCDEAPEPGQSACTPGEEGCECAQSEACGEGLSCDRGYCVVDTNNASNGGMNNANNGGTNNNNGGNNGGADGVGLDIDSDEARSCEVVVVDQANAIDEVTFEDDVEGRSMRRGERLALAFFVKGDSVIPSGAVNFALRQEGSSEGLQLTNGRCFDGQGQEINGAALALRSAAQ